MLHGLDIGNMKYVVELGPGTGVFTEELYRRLPDDAEVMVIELDAGYVKDLKRRFGDRFDIFQASASELENLVAERNWPRVDFVISGLPFVIPQSVKEVLFASLKARTDQGTVFRFFTYMPPLMKPHYRDFDLNLVRFVGANFPPMWIYSVN